MQMPQDFVELLAAFAKVKLRYLIVGGYAVGAHHVPRFTKDIDLLVERTPENIARCADALAAFGAPDSVVDAMRSSQPDDVVWLGHPPLRIDILQWIPGVDFTAAWPRRLDATWDGVAVSVLGLDDLIAAKVAAGRPQDRLDAQALRRVRQG